MLDPTATVATDAASAQMTRWMEAQRRIDQLCTARSLLSSTDFLLQAMPDCMPVVDDLGVLIGQAVEKINMVMADDLAIRDPRPVSKPETEAARPAPVVPWQAEVRLYDAYGLTAHLIDYLGAPHEGGRSLLGAQKIAEGIKTKLGEAIEKALPPNMA
jgi:hypothetical protein